MPRAPQRCSPSCSNKIFKYGKCIEHQPEKKAWAGSNRKSAYLNSAAWQRQRRRVIHDRKGICQRCGAENSRQVDHIVPVWYSQRDKVEDHELQLLCDTCHADKSSYEGVQAKRIKRASRGL